MAGTDSAPTIQMDPEFRALIPPLTAEERRQLEINLTTDGCRDPLVVWNGLLLDGHHRFEICLRQQLTYRIVEQACPDRNAAKVWIIQHQFGRRNLNMAQRAELAMHLEPLIAAQAKAREWSGPNLGSNEPRSKTTEQLAAIAGISAPSMTRAVAVFKRGTPELKEAMRSGKVKVSAAYDRLKAGEAVLAPPRIVKPYIHKQTVRKETDVIAALSTLLEEFRQKRKANHDDLETRKWRPHGILVVRQTEISNWLDAELVQLITRLRVLLQNAADPRPNKARTPSQGHSHAH